jgi:alkylation response protein AidB-like acyl-CoA dehydrogenase
MMSMPGRASLFERLCLGQADRGFLFPFPAQDQEDEAVGDALVWQLQRFLKEHVNPAAIDQTGQLPAGLIEQLKSHGYLALQLGAAQGGLGLSNYNAFRLIAATAAWSPAVALVIGVQNAIGAAPMLGVIPAGPLSDLVSARLSEGVVSGSADTEPAGAANASRRTTATPAADGSGYLINGEKVHIGNAPVADFVTVTATLRPPGGEPGDERIRMFFVDTRSEGVEVAAWHEFMGLKGFPNGMFRFTGVNVPAIQLLESADGGQDTRISDDLMLILALGRLYLIGAPSLAIARLCVRWTRDFAARRVVDGRGLGDYQEIQRLIALSAADTFAIDCVTRWCLLAGEGGRPVNPRFEQVAAKNITSVLCWRVVDRAMSLLAAEGYETAASKSGRGGVPVPLERFFRDARALRISGGVDFLLDFWLSKFGVFSYFYPTLPDEPTEEPPPGTAGGQFLSSRNREHQRYLTAHAVRFSRTCRSLARRYPDRLDLFEQQRTLILLSRIVCESITMELVLARAGSTGPDDEDPQRLADLYCAGGRRRLDGWWGELDGTDEPDHAEISRACLAGELDGLLGGDLITDLPPAR